MIPIRSSIHIQNEILNNIDDNCNGEIDEGLVSVNIIDEDVFQIYPNPNDGNFIISSKLHDQGQFDIYLFNVNGILVFQKTFGYNPELEINLRPIPNGLFTLQVVSFKINLLMNIVIYYEK